MIQAEEVAFHGGEKVSVGALWKGYLITSIEVFPLELDSGAVEVSCNFYSNKNLVGTSYNMSCIITHKVELK